ncbi:hypothetical protein TSTA_042070 [Talaromyces stipitatus ATCC 10500]|uniref:Uncharacterized protein n=1 Tax=Talaromyces stipitatus (strain ATCC 10500 / CBS 375.48 / QM 6759 / NRRL 1006) TaxID=441959 RepID=B8MJR5_TALSN|nr:uncharacterized protein TSTA_042070 [Talaromyces stipitatus ATCC 10500]EED14732.1 hypothetical protein TSTA_042070 [Talaromyces stipitatus ATCC 10500]
MSTTEEESTDCIQDGLEDGKNHIFLKAEATEGELERARIERQKSFEGHRKALPLKVEVLTLNYPEEDLEKIDVLRGHHNIDRDETGNASTPYWVVSQTATS